VRLKKGQKLQARPMEEMIEDGRILFPEDQDIQVWETLPSLKHAIKDDMVPKRGKCSIDQRH
jgi:hypothetical protein